MTPSTATYTSALPRPGRPAARGAFTLIELLVVMGIIVLIIVFALPAFRFLSSDRSVEAAQNLLASTLGTARAAAIGTQQPRGLAIYRDAATDRLAMALVEFKAVPGTWLSSVDYNVGDYVQYGTPANVYVCTLPIAAGANNPPAQPGNWSLVGTQAALTPYFGNGSTVIDFVADTDQVLLPSGIDGRGIGTVVSGGTQRYLTPAIIMFDGNGMLSPSPFNILSQGTLGVAAQITNTGPGPAPALQTVGTVNFYGNNINPGGTQFSSQIGVALFDSEMYKNAGNTDDWIDTNAAPLLVNRYNGTLFSGQ